MKRVLLTVFLVLGISPQLIFSQIHFTSEDVKIVNEANSHIYLNGKAELRGSSEITNGGSIHLFGDFENNSSTEGFSSVQKGEVFLEGDVQDIGGTHSSSFDELHLLGNNNKSLSNNISVNGVLFLYDKELLADTHNVYIGSPDPASLNRSTGFVSNTYPGALHRNLIAPVFYEFPIAATSGLNRYRPLEVKPVSPSPQSFYATMINNDPTLDGFDPAQNDGSICGLNPNFYHRIGRVSGFSPVDLKIQYDDSLDGNYASIAHWKNTPEWTTVGPTFFSIQNSPALSSVTLTGYNDFGDEPFSLSRAAPELDLVVSSDSICSGEAIDFQAVSGFSSYSFFQNGTQLTTGQEAFYSFSDVQDGDTLLVTADNGTACVKSGYIVASVKNSPVVPLGEVENYCEGTDLILNAGSGGQDYVWSDGSQGAQLAVTGTGVVSVKVTAGNGCSTIKTVNYVEVPGPEVFLGNDTSSCTPMSLTLDAGTSGSDYEWSTGQTTPTINVSMSGTYSVSVEDGYGCKSEASIGISISPDPQVDLGGDAGICDNQAVQLNAGNPGASYSWSNGSTLPEISVGVEGTYWVEVTYTGGCSGTDTVFVESAERVVPHIGCDTLSTPTIYFWDLSTGEPTSWWWDFGDGTTSTEEMPVHTFTSNGEFLLTFAAENICGREEMQKIVPVKSVSNDPLIGFRNVLVYPNPSPDQVFVVMDGFEGEDATIEIIDLDGKVLETHSLYVKGKRMEKELNLGSFSIGVYFVKVKTESNSWVKKIRKD